MNVATCPTNAEILKVLPKAGLWSNRVKMAALRVQRHIKNQPAGSAFVTHS